ncbi:hypothetical protein HU200_016705 [Digitaria exilis]|nr:hypothetical protein HU200_016705 [Digitaria exilis]
MHTSIS